MTLYALQTIIAGHMPTEEAAAQSASRLRVRSLRNLFGRAAR